MPPDYEVGTTATLDAVLEGIASALGVRWPEQRLTIDFTAEEQ